MAAIEELISLNNIVKVYPPNVLALDDVSISFREGEIHALVGENGAGKSTLMKVLYGLVPFTQGIIFYRGRRVRFQEPGEAIAAGIGMVHQEILLIPEFTVWENIVLGNEPVDIWGRLDEERARQLVGEKIQEFQFHLNPSARVEDISVAARQKVEILKLLYRRVSVLILDEPTAVLTPQEIPLLFAELSRLRASGHTIIFISHRLEEVLALSDRITVLRKGKKVATVEAGETTRQELARLMVGRDVLFLSRRKPQTPGKVVFKTENLNFVNNQSRHQLHNIQLKVHAGEIVAVAGVEGNGQFELVNAIMGLNQPTSGKIFVDTTDITQTDILERRRLISFVPQDRGKMGASLSAMVMENAMMTHHRLNPRFILWKGLLLNFNYAQIFTDQIVDRFKVILSSKFSPFRSLSGGNQQKVILGRELLLDNPFLLLDQPTRGLDVGSIEYVHEQILRIRQEGKAILMISADLEEIFLLADRIVVLYRGELVADLPSDKTNVEEIGRYMLTGKAIPE